MKTRNWMLVSPDRLSLGTSPDGAVLLQMERDSGAAPWLSPDLLFAFEFTPEQARVVAESLIAKAAEAEAWQDKIQLSRL